MLGNTLRKIRKQKGLTVRDLAFRTGVHFTTISAIERGRQQPSQELLHRLVKVLGVSISELETTGRRLKQHWERQRQPKVRLSVMARSLRDFLAQQFLDDIRREISWEEAGWRQWPDANFPGDDNALRQLLEQGICKKDDVRGMRICPEFYSTTTAERPRQLKEAWDLCQIRTLWKQDKRKCIVGRKELQRLVTAVAGQKIISWSPLVVAGIVAMIRNSESLGIIDGVLKAGFSPGNWPVVVQRSAPWAVTVAADRSNWSVESPVIAVEFFTRLGWIELARDLVVSESLRGEGEKVMRVLALDEVLKAWGKPATQVLSFLWVGATQLEHRDFLTRTEEGDILLEKMVWDLMVEALGQSEQNLRDILAKAERNMRLRTYNSIGKQKIFLWEQVGGIVLPFGG